MISIEGLELTQAIQFYRSERRLDPATAEPDNSVPLVASKPVAVRVYPDVQAPGAVAGALVDGDLSFRREGGPWIPAARLNGPVAGREAVRIDRGDPGQTLNFLIPAEEAGGTIEIRASARAGPSEKGSLEAVHIARASFVETHPLRLRLFGVRWTGGGREVPPPSAAEALETLAFLRKTWPCSRVEVVSYETLRFGGDLADPSGEGCGRGWNTLLLQLYRLRAASLGTDIFYALVPRGVPNAGVAGAGSPLGVGASYALDGTSLAQEVAHVLHRPHAPRPELGGDDPEYPAYGSYPPASIGEYGFDVEAERVHPPDTSSDFMSDAESYWVSPHTYRKLLDALGSGPRAMEGGAPPPAASPRGCGGLRVDLEPLRTGPRRLLRGTASLSWRVSCPEGDRLSVHLRYSTDGGHEWRPVPADLDLEGARVDVDDLPGGEDCRFQVVATSSLETATRETEAFRVERKPRRASIALDEHRRGCARCVELTGTAHSPEGFASGEEIAWRSSLEGPLGTGSRKVLRGLGAGRHIISMEAPDGLGGTARAEVAVEIPAAGETRGPP